jgi:hypothetical protein
VEASAPRGRHAQGLDAARAVESCGLGSRPVACVEERNQGLLRGAQRGVVLSGALYSGQTTDRPVACAPARGPLPAAAPPAPAPASVHVLSSSRRRLAAGWHAGRQGAGRRRQVHAAALLTRERGRVVIFKAPRHVANPFSRRDRPISPLNTHADRSRTALGVENLSGAPPSPLARWPASCRQSAVGASQPVKLYRVSGASQPVKLYRRQSARQIISAPVSPSNHLDASQPVKSSRRQSARQIISTPVSPSNHLDGSQPCKSSRRQSATQMMTSHGRPSK